MESNMAYLSFVSLRSKHIPIQVFKQKASFSGVLSMSSFSESESLSWEGTSGDHLVYTPCSEQDQQAQVAQDCVQQDFEYLKGWHIHSLSGFVLVFDHHHSKKVFMLKWNFLYFSLCLLPALSLSTTEKSLAPPSSFPLSEVFI